MKEIQPQMSTEHYWKDLAFTYVRLKENPKTEHLAPAVFAHVGRYDELLKAEREMEWAVVERQAYAKAADERVEKHLRDVQASVLFLVKQDRKDSRYLDLFKGGLTQLLRLKSKDQKDELERMKLVMKRGDYEDVFRGEQIELLDEALIVIDSVTAGHLELEQRQYTHQSVVQQWKADANRVRRDVFGDLLKLSESSGMGWAKGFFRIVRKAPKMSAEERTKRNVARAKKKMEKAAEAHALATSETFKAEQKAAMEQAKAEVEARFKQMNQTGRGETTELFNVGQPHPPEIQDEAPRA